MRFTLTEQFKGNIFTIYNNTYSLDNTIVSSKRLFLFLSIEGRSFLAGVLTVNLGEASPKSRTKKRWLSTSNSISLCIKQQKQESMMTSPLCIRIIAESVLITTNLNHMVSMFYHEFWMDL